MISNKKFFKSNRSILLVCVTLMLILTTHNTMWGSVKKMEILLEKPFAGGESFGEVGQYQLIKGILHYEIDPDDPANQAVVDLQFAPKNADGNVEFSGEFVLLKPVDLSRGNHRLLYDVTNRGNLVALLGLNDAPYNNLPVNKGDGGNGFLMREGYTLLWSAWNWDVTPGDNRLQIDLPVATIEGKPITQKIAAEIVLFFEKEPVRSQPLAWGDSRCYPAINPTNKEDKKLTVRDEPRGKRRIIPGNLWRFAREDNGKLVRDASWLHLESGFQPGKIYELIYRAKDPRVVGLGLTAVRDAISFFRFAADNRNPLLVKENGILKPDPEKAYIFGVSQSGRFITHMIYEGFHVDEKKRMVFEGARIHVGGAGKGSFNHRFAQPTHHPCHLEGNYMPADFFPFNFAEQKDPVTGRTGDVLAVAKRLGKIPYIMITNNDLEYWTRSASLIHTDVTGKTDAPLHPNVRIYLTCGAAHRSTPSRSRYNGLFEHSLNPMNHYPVSRALMRAMDLWVGKNIAPPDSKFPKNQRKELLTSKEHKLKFPKIPGMRHPGTNLNPPRVDYGPDFWSKGIFTKVPPVQGESFQTMVPAFDKDGNSIGGIRLPELSVPLGTYQGWNPWMEKYGTAGNYMARYDGSFWPLAFTEKERKEKNDPRSSIEKRYPSKKIYVKRIEEAVKKLMEEGFMLEEDALRYIKKARDMAWPPKMIDGPPFWVSSE